MHARKILRAKNAAVPAAAKKGGASLFKKRCPSLKPSQRKFHVGSLWLEWSLCLRNENACQAMVLNDLVCSYLRCRSAHLVEVQPNFRLPPVSTMRRAPAIPLFRTQSAAEQTSLASHGSKARLQDVTKHRDSWRSHVHRTYIAQRMQSFKPKAANVRGQGARPLAFSWGI